MKPAPFELLCARSLAELGGFLAESPETRVMAGGQSLGPMLNLRLARPQRVVTIAGLQELIGYTRTDAGLTIGACVTHAAIADGRIPIDGYPMLRRIADGIAYPAIRTRGTIGGSLAHADPAADWVVTLTALDATILTWRMGSPGRAIPIRHFMLGAYTTALEPGEIVQAVRIPPPGAGSRWGYFKACRKPGEFAHAMAAVIADETRGIRRLVIGATGGAPLVFEGDAALPENFVGDGDPVSAKLQLETTRRAWAALA